MGTELIRGVYFFALPVIATTGGTVMHAVKGFDDHLPEFGECYFSTAAPKEPKAWKKHSGMICNLFVPKGEVRFVFYDDRAGTAPDKKITEFTISKLNYGRLVIQPGIWFGFSGLGNEESIIMNIANIPHDPAEALRLEPGALEIPYRWRFDQ